MTYQKLYKIYLRDARIEEADRVLQKMRLLMQADGAAGLPGNFFFWGQYFFGDNIFLGKMRLPMQADGAAGLRYLCMYVCIYVCM